MPKTQESLIEYIRTAAGLTAPEAIRRLGWTRQRYYAHKLNTTGERVEALAVFAKAWDLHPKTISNIVAVWLEKALSKSVRKTKGSDSHDGD